MPISFLPVQPADVSESRRISGRHPFPGGSRNGDEKRNARELRSGFSRKGDHNEGALKSLFGKNIRGRNITKYSVEVVYFSINTEIRGHEERRRGKAGDG